MENLRLFWAVNLPVDIKAKLVDLQRQLTKVRADVKWVEEENFHLTVKFLGNVEPVKVPAIFEQVKKEVAGVGAISLEIQNLGVFPQQGMPRVLWVGLQGEKDKLIAMHNHVQKALITLGFAPEGKPFSPHLTLGRIRSPRKTQKLLEEITCLNNQNRVIGNVLVKTLDLMESELTRQGPVYSILGSIKL
ncbi:RNA 2',3'-cyclic phosphodiesterase [Desulfolucanica intricata]|uniref:RNA 2',3'-cyclic phosphodiesterase n=1 Tax=Desulfolucanica intricata TaxID=1285191 RepID=UPI00082BDBD3|nr:RNA 2',3'-cyclic phosphodiesterase [Desulfolucanica intricata]